MQARVSYIGAIRLLKSVFETCSIMLFLFLFSICNGCHKYGVVVCWYHMF